MSKREGGTLVPQTIQNLSMILRKIRVSKYFLYWDLEPRWPLSFCSSPWTGNRNLSYILTLSNIFLVYLKYPQRTWFLRSGTSSLKPDVFFVTLDHSSFRQSESCNIILYICMLFCKCPLVDRTGITVQFSRSVMSSFLQLHGLQQARPPCPSPTPRVYANSCPLSPWCHPAISSSVVPFSSRLQSFPTSGSFPMSQFFASGGQSIGASVSASVLPMNVQDWFPLGN